MNQERPSRSGKTRQVGKKSTETLPSKRGGRGDENRGKTQEIRPHARRENIAQGKRILVKRERHPSRQLWGRRE